MCNISTSVCTHWVNKTLSINKMLFRIIQSFSKYINIISINQFNVLHHVIKVTLIYLRLYVIQAVICNY